jgi:preprotein translocase subunit SecE
MSWVDRAQRFLDEVRIEARKVSWPSRTEVRQSTIVVFITVVVLTVFIFLVDQVMNRGVQVVL